MSRILEALAVGERYLFTPADFYQVFPDMGMSALGMLLSRAVKGGLLRRVCKGVYLYSKAGYSRGFELYHTAALLRADTFCYLSLESVLSETGVISQIPQAWITVITGGRRGVVDCGPWGHIEFVHATHFPAGFEQELCYDPRCRLWRASVFLALRDMRRMRRPLDLIDWDAAREFTEKGAAYGAV
ncbi:MAG: type IV toxin-antitoxin system AbiEi family antitoxin domain-containing protein [Treponematales bacterium]